MIKTFTKFNEDEELKDFEEDLVNESANTVTERYKAGEAGTQIKVNQKQRYDLEQMVLK